MRPTQKLTGTFVALAALMLYGCNSNQPKPEEPQVQSSAAAVNSSESKAPQATPTPPKPPVIVQNPSTISFQKMGVTLDNGGKETVAQIVERARNSRKITVTGFCDRNQIANPTEAAIARAVAVRDELVAHGVAPASMQVKFNVKIPKKHAVEVQFD